MKNLVGSPKHSPEIILYTLFYTSSIFSCLMILIVKFIILNFTLIAFYLIFINFNFKLNPIQYETQLYNLVSMSNVNNLLDEEKTQRGCKI